MAQIHADIAKAATVRARELEWVASPSPGVQRMRIERDGDEVARLTSVVRYAAGSVFPEHTHGGGEEYLVLAGTFSDADGDHIEGTYVRNGVGTSHAPFTLGGCTILVKLRWMHESETGQHVVNAANPLVWREAPDGSEVVLWKDERETVRLVEVFEGERTIAHARGVELFVVAGDVTVNGEALSTWDWARRPGDTSVRIACETAARLYVKTGHLSGS